jgi:hypothetical protein
MTRCIDCGGEIVEGEDHRCHTILTQPDRLAAQLDGFTARLGEIAEDSSERFPEVRALVVAQSAMIAIWSYAEDEALKASLARLMHALSLKKPEPEPAPRTRDERWQAIAEHIVNVSIRKEFGIS